MKGIDATSTRYPFLLGKWTPGGLELPERVPGDLEQAATIGVHLIEVDILVLSRCGSMHKDDLRAIGRPGGEVISNTCRVWGLCELHGMAAIGMHDPERLISRVAVGTNRILRHTIDNLAAIGRP